MEAVDASELVSDATVSFSAGEATGMIVPASITGEVGSEITLPTNFTMYVEGKTLTGWSDGTTSYAPGASYTVPSADITLAPVFTENTVSLADRTEPVTLKWDFQRVNGAPTISSQNGTGLWVTQAIIGNETIDVKLDFDTNNGGKLANGNWTDWCQMNGGTTLTIPNYKGATVSMEAYNVITTTTIDGQSDYTQAKTISYTVANTAETIDIVIGDGTYYRYVQTVLPVVETRQASDLTLTSSNAVSLDANTTTSQITATTSATVGLTYTSSNPMVATVSNTGLITAVANGTATITVAQVGDATYMDDSKTVTVTVNNGVSASYSIAAQINNQSGTMLTSAETAAQGNAVSFGINAAGERVAADAADAVVTISGNYHSDHGVTNLVATVKATGNMMITIGNCTYNNGTITVSKGGQTVISESLSNTACWKNDHSDVTQVLYEGEAATLTVSVPNYCPYFAVESVAEVTKYTVTFMNGNETVDTKQVAEGTALGTLPTPTYDTDTQCFLGWYSDTDDLGTKAYTSTVPTGNTTLYAIIIDKPTEAAGYYVVNNGRELMAMIDYANANANATTL